MTGAEIIAGYAAVVATGNVAWQIWNGRRADKVKVRVEVAQAAAGTGPMGQAQWHVQITVRNQGRLPVTVDGVGLYLQDGSGRTLVQARPSIIDTVPGRAEPKHHVKGFLLMENAEAQGFNFKAPVTAFANLSDGSTVRSAPKTLRSD